MFCTAVTITGFASQAEAQTSAVAEALFQEGHKLLRSGDLQHACEKFQESQRLEPSAGTLLSLTTCHQRQGKTATAWTEALQAETLARAQGDRPEQVALAQELVRELHSQLAYLTVEVAQPVAGMVLELGSVALGTAAIGTATPVDPGDYDLSARAPGYEPFSTRVHVPTGAQSLVIAVPTMIQTPAAPLPRTPPPARFAPAPRVAPERTPTPNRTWAYVAGSTALACLAVGAYAGVEFLKKDDELVKRCGGDVKNCPAAAIAGAQPLANARFTYAVIAPVALSAGVLGMGAAAYLWLNPLGSRTKTVQLEPQVGLNHAGLRVSGVF